jgi:DNA-binding transcriptional LysR family regulator
VEEGYDLAIRIGRLADSSLIARRIGEMRLIVCASPAYLAAHDRPLTPADLSRHECVLYSYASTGAVWKFSGSNGEEVVRVGGRVVCNNGDAICNMAINGLGLIAQPDFIVTPHLRSGVLEQVLGEYTDAAGIYAIYPSHRHVPLKLRKFIELLSTAFGNAPLRI